MYFFGLNSDANDLDNDWQLKTKVDCAKLEKSLTLQKPILSNTLSVDIQINIISQNF